MRAVPHLVLWRLGLAGAETQTTERERQALGRHASGLTRLVEIGVWHGVTTAVLRAAMAPGGTLWAVDPFPAGRLLFSPQRVVAHGQVRTVSNGAVHWICATGVEAATRYRAAGLAPAELIFFDADHSYAGVTADWQAWRPLVAGGGVVGFHDSVPTPDRPFATGTVQAVEEIARHDAEFDVVEVVDALTVLRRRAR